MCLIIFDLLWKGILEEFHMEVGLVNNLVYMSTLSIVKEFHMEVGLVNNLVYMSM